MTDTNYESQLRAVSSRQSIRLFESNLMEWLSHVHPIIPLLFWSPLVVFLLYRSVQDQALEGTTMALIAALAILTWTFTEYALHRFVFHFRARNKTAKNLVFTFHGVHHSTPQDKTRLVMPPAGAVIFLGLFWILFGAVLPETWHGAFFAFFIVGYLIYDYIHYAIHHFPMKNPVARYLKIHHMQHHFKKPNGNYGVSSPLWDFIFRTH